MKIFYKCLPKAAVAVALLGLSFSCNKILDIKPVNSMIPKSLDDMEALLLGGYPRTDFFMSTEMLTDNVYFNPNADLLPSAAQERWFSFASSVVAPGTLSDPYWGQLYKSIFYANTVLDFLQQDVPGSDNKELMEQIKGEAYALRAYGYFYLINYYADVYSNDNLGKPGVPMPLSAENIVDYSGNNTRATIGEVWQQIVKDIEQSLSLLQGKQMTDRYRFSYNTVRLFKARVALMMENYTQAIDDASYIVDNYPLADLSGLEQKLEESPSGASGVLVYNYGYINTNINQELLFFTGGKSNFNTYYYATGCMKPAEELLAQTKRYGNLTDYRQFVYDAFSDPASSQAIKTGPTVYRMYASQDLVFYYVGFKASEAYLIRAEANARENKPEAAISDINQILASRMRKASLVVLRASDFKDQQAVLDRVLEERRLELAFDGGLRFMDLRRLGKPSIVHVYKDATTYTLQKDDPRYILQIPPSEEQNSPEMPKNPR